MTLINEFGDTLICVDCGGEADLLCDRCSQPLCFECTGDYVMCESCEELQP